MYYVLCIIDVVEKAGRRGKGRMGEERRSLWISSLRKSAVFLCVNLREKSRAGYAGRASRAGRAGRAGLLYWVNINIHRLHLSGCEFLVSLRAIADETNEYH
jgi:hypothetical protein